MEIFHCMTNLHFRVEGGDLFELIKTSVRLEPECVKFIFYQMCLAIKVSSKQLQLISYILNIKACYIIRSYSILICKC